MLTSQLLPASLLHPGSGRAPSTVPSTQGEVNYALGLPGLCTGSWRHFIFVLDDSPSVSGPGGNDPLSRRYAEARHAVRTLARSCTCRRELASVWHFDASTLDVEPTPLHRTKRVLAGLQQPHAGGSSELLPALRRARFANTSTSLYREVETKLFVLSDFVLLDKRPDTVFAKLSTFPGRVTAVVLGTEPDPRLSDVRFKTVRLTTESEPGSLARALFADLTSGRSGRRLIVGAHE